MNVIVDVKPHVLMIKNLLKQVKDEALKAGYQEGYEAAKKELQDNGSAS